MIENTENREEIVQTAENLFLAYGVRSVTMDDISKKLAISKKTIYQHYRDKDEIVCRVTQRFLEREKKMVLEIKDKAQDAIHELILISKYLREHLQNVNPSVLFDLQKYHRGAWSIYLKFKEKVFLNAVEETLARGIKEEVFRENINIQVLAILRVEEIQMLFDSDIFPRDKFNFKEVQMQLFEHFTRGILTPKGATLINQYTES